MLEVELDAAELPAFGRARGATSSGSQPVSSVCAVTAAAHARAGAVKAGHVRRLAVSGW
jgi:hypothetical protein